MLCENAGTACAGRVQMSAVTKGTARGRKRSASGTADSGR